MSGGASETVGILLAGGRGERAKPITLESADYIRSKALIPFAGRRLIEWVVDACREQGIRRFFVVAQGLENRSQIKALLEHGERYGVEVRYSRRRFDRYNVGSGAATLHNLEEWDLTGRALVLPVDSIFDFDLAALSAAHEEREAMVTVAAVPRTPAEIAGKYGVMATDHRRVTGFVEKPGLDQIGALIPDGAENDALLPTNAGMYLIDCAALRAAARRPELMRLAHQRLDWGRDLLPYLVAQGHPVVAHYISRLGDLGNVHDYLRTLAEVLGGEYAQMNQLLPIPSSVEPRFWIHESSLGMTDDISGRTLAEKLADGSVTIGPGVRIGRYVSLGPGVHVEESDIGDSAEIGQDTRLVRSFCGDAAVIGPHASIADSYIGPMVEVQSTAWAPATLEHFTAIGDGAELFAGSRLSGVGVYPRLSVPPLSNLPVGTVLTNSDDILRWVP